MADSPFRPLAEKAAEEAGLDPAFVTKLVGAESSWNPDAVSKKGARGLMQLMPATAKQYGVANPHDPVENIRGGVAYLKDLSAKYPGRPDLVAAAYNAGPEAVDKAGGVPNYPETKDYVKKVVGEGGGQTLAQLVRAKYPDAYKDLSDEALEAAIDKKYPGAYASVGRSAKPKNEATGTTPPKPAQVADKPKEPEDYWGGFRKGWTEGGTAGFKGYVNAFAGAPRRAVEGAINLIEGLNKDPGQTAVNIGLGLLDMPGQLIKATREAGTNPEGFGYALGTPISDALLPNVAPKVAGWASRAALHHVLPGGAGAILRGAKVLSDLGKAAEETAPVRQTAAEAAASRPPVTAPGPPVTAPEPLSPGFKSGGRSASRPVYDPQAATVRPKPVPVQEPFSEEGWRESQRRFGGNTPQAEAPAKPPVTAPGPPVGTPATEAPAFKPNMERLTPMRGASNATKMHMVAEEGERQGLRTLTTAEMERGTRMIAHGGDPIEVYQQIVSGKAAPAVDPAAEFAKRFGLPSQEEVDATMGKQARGGKKSLMAQYGDK